MNSAKKRRVFFASTIKNKIIITCCAFLAIILVSGIYTSVDNYLIIQQQKSITEERLQKLLLTENLSGYLTKTALYNRSYVLFGQLELLNENNIIWDNYLTPASKTLKETQNSFSIQDQERIEDILSSLSTYKAIQGQIESEVQKIKKTMGEGDSFELTPFLEDLLIQKAVPVANTIAQNAKLLSDEQRQKINEESQLIIDKLNAQQNSIYLIITISLLLGTLLFYFLLNATTKPLNQLSQYLNDIALGKLPHTIEASKDEIGAMIGAINKLVIHLKNAASFANSIGEGNFNHAFKPAGDEDTLGNALVNMKEKLEEVDKEDEKRNWTSEGLTKMAEILRKQNDNLENLGTESLSFLIKYMDAVMGGIFIINDQIENDRHLELMSSYAYDRKKFFEKRIEIGEGIIGQSVIEGATMNIKGLAPGYMEISSGLGMQSPNHLLVVPLKQTGEEVYGAIEIASQNEFSEHQIAFVEKIAEIIAGTISGMKINERTKKLLEESQVQAEQLRAQEEEMRQNTEELAATQEEAERTIRELQRLLKTKEDELFKLKEKLEL
jgi:HAMP domain-containing protein/putative methionine-R-sulfoxide reductase with GAF domain